MSVEKGQPLSRAEYINLYASYAQEQMEKYGIPASVTLAQAIIESGDGNSSLAKDYNAHFGVTVNPKSGLPYVTKFDRTHNNHFRVFNSVAESYENHSTTLMASRYSRCHVLSADDYEGWTRGIAASGYAEDPNYAQTILSVIKRNHLDQFDKEVMDRMAAQGRQPGYARGSSVKGVGTSPSVAPSPSQGNNQREASPRVMPGASPTQHFSLPLLRTKDQPLLVTSGFGMRVDPVNGGQQNHKGIDIAQLSSAPEPVLATEDLGRVVSTKPTEGGGKTVRVEYTRSDGTRYRTSYCHLSEVSVREGDIVNAGTVLGKTGNTGSHTTGAHLDFKVEKLDASGQSLGFVNPLDYIAELQVRGNLYATVYDKAGNDLTSSRKRDLWNAGFRPESANGSSMAMYQSQSASNPFEWMQKLMSGSGETTGEDEEFSIFHLLLPLLLMSLTKQKAPASTQMAATTDLHSSRTVDLSALLPEMSNVSMSQNRDGTVTLHTVSVNGEYDRVLTTKEAAALSGVLSNTTLSESEKSNAVRHLLGQSVGTSLAAQNYDLASSEQESQGRGLTV